MGSRFEKKHQALTISVVGNGQDGPKACDSLLSFDECFGKDWDDDAGNVSTVGTVGANGLTLRHFWNSV